MPVPDSTAPSTNPMISANSSSRHGSESGTADTCNRSRAISYDVDAVDRSCARRCKGVMVVVLRLYNNVGYLWLYIHDMYYRLMLLGAIVGFFLLLTAAFH